jgi:16S rRNA (guanine527-N7)-methyltransferase
MRAELIEKYFPLLSSKQLSQYEGLYELYSFWNERINVISRKDIDQLYLHHVLHSLAIAKTISFSNGVLVLDFGTGGGFPGIPLAIMFPEVKFFLVDSIAKKINVVNEVTQSLKLLNVSTSHSRVEELKGKYDYITCRAVAPINEIYQWTKHLYDKASLSNDSGWVLLKGGDLNQEIAEIKKQAKITSISDFFSEDYFNEKYIVQFK